MGLGVKGAHQALRARGSGAWGVAAQAEGREGRPGCGLRELCRAHGGGLGVAVAGKAVKGAGHMGGWAPTGTLGAVGSLTSLWGWRSGPGPHTTSHTSL